MFGTTSIRMAIAVGSAAALLAVSGCGGGQDFESEFDALIEAEQWEEILARVEVHHAEGVRDGMLDFAEGLALLHQNADAAAEAPLDRAVADDPSRAPRIAAAYAELARADREAEWNERARRRMARAVHFDPDTEAGPLTADAADWFYREAKDYASALPLYRRLAEELPEPVDEHPLYVYRYGYCLEEAERDDEALEVYGEFLRRFPAERTFMRFVQWRAMSLRVERAEALLGTAQPEAALDELAFCLASDWHLELQQQARFVAARAEEARGDLQAAREYYELVVDTGSRFGGDVVRRASRRLEELGELGVH